MNIKKVIKSFIPERINRSISIFLHPHSYEWVSNVSKYPYESDGLATKHKHEFMRDKKFLTAFAEAEKYLLAPGMYWRTYVICWAANKGRSIEGDFVECGVFKGGFAKAVTSYTEFSNIADKKYYLFDTYTGLAEKYSSEKEKKREKDYHRYETDYFDEAKRNFESFKNVVLVKGMVPETLLSVEINKVAFLSIDMNSAIPEKHALEHFWDKLSSGAVIVLDDYGFNGYEEQRKVHEEFAKSKNCEILSLPTGQGLIFKP
jgi:O-methyltransferase